MQNTESVSTHHVQEQALALDSTNIRFKKNILPWIMFTIAATFYCYAYFLRVAPSMMMKELTAHFQITATQFGHLSAFYYYAYTPLQLPIGVIIDRFGARMVLAIAALLAVSGISIFVSTDSFQLACLGRFMMGFGSAFGYITVLKVATYWLPANRFATAAGLTTAFGMIAAIFTDNYLAKVVQSVGFKQSLFFSIIAGLVLGGVILSLLRSKPKPEYAHHENPEQKTTFSELFSGMGRMLMNSQTWLIGIVGCLLYLPASVFLDLWGIPYLETVYHLKPVEAAHVISMVFIGWIIGGPMIGAISDAIQLRRLPLLLSSIVAAILMAIVFYVPNVPVFWVYVSMLFLGITCGSHPLVFSLSRENNSRKISGTATATTNFLIMSGGLVFQPVVGMLLDSHWQGATVDGLRQYTVGDYNYALAIVPVGLILSVLLTFFIKETRCKMPD